MSELQVGLLVGLGLGALLSAYFCLWIFELNRDYKRVLSAWKKSNADWERFCGESFDRWQKTVDDLHAAALELHNSWLDWAYKNVPALELIQPRHKKPEKGN